MSRVEKLRNNIPSIPVRSRAAAIATTISIVPSLRRIGIVARLTRAFKGECTLPKKALSAPH